MTTPWKTMRPLPGIKKLYTRGAWLPWSVEHATLDLTVMGSSPTLGIKLT